MGARWCVGCEYLLRDYAQVNRTKEGSGDEGREKLREAKGEREEGIKSSCTPTQRGCFNVHIYVFIMISLLGSENTCNHKNRGTMA